MFKQMDELSFEEILSYVQEKIQTQEFLMIACIEDRKLLFSSQEEFERLKEQSKQSELKFIKILVHSNQEQLYKINQKQEQDAQNKIIPSKKNSQKQSDIQPQRKQSEEIQKCTICSRKLDDLVKRYICLICQNIIICLDCEQTDQHIEHPLIQLKTHNHQQIMKNRSKGRVSQFFSNIFEKFACSESKDVANQLIAQQKQDNLTEKLQNSNEQENEKTLRTMKIAEIFQSNSQKIKEYINENDNLTDDQIIEIILQNAEAFDLKI